MSEVKIITAEPTGLRDYCSKLWQYRGMVMLFAKRDLKVRYAQTLLGVFWVLFQPLPSILIFSFFFSYLIKADTGILPYPVFALIGMSGWTYFTGLTSSIGNSLIDAQNLLKKVYFPKTIIHISKIISGAADFGAALLLIIVAMLIFRVVPSWQIVFLPVFFALNAITGFAVGIWISALTFKRRDFQNIAPAIINFSIWLTPVFYPVTIIPQQFSYFMYFNPMALVIEGYRYALSGQHLPSFHYIMSLIPLTLLLVSGLWYFRRVEDEITDYV